MKKIFFILFLSFALFAQNDTSIATTNIEIQMFTLQLGEAQKKILNFLAEKEVKPISQSVQKNSLETEFTISQKSLAEFNLLLKELGYFTKNKTLTIDIQKKIQEIELNLEYLTKKKKSYEELIAKLDERSDKYINFWNELKRIEDSIFEKKKELLSVSTKGNLITVNFEIKQEVTTPEYSDVAFVNMPGVEFSMFNPENPHEKISAETYYGYTLKYLFTKGKSYATVSVFKPKAKSTNDSLFTDLFVIGFGQDFYSRHYGRGENTFFNLYSGYLTGLTIANNKNEKDSFFFISPSVGLELLKTTNFLIDSKVSYYIPFRNTKNLRGLNYSLSLNFVF